MSKTRLPRLASLCVFCGASAGTDPGFRDDARRLGARMAAEGVALVYGGGHLGMMGALAEAVMAGGGRVIGFIPEHLTRVEKAYREITELHVVESMHTRKRMMFDRADAFAVLPGGMGTMDETFEILTWKQLRLHNKPVLIVNLDGYWSPWLTLVGHIIGKGFAHPDTEKLYTVVDRVDDVVEAAQAGMVHAATGDPRLF